MFFAGGALESCLATTAALAVLSGHDQTQGRGSVSHLLDLQVILCQIKSELCRSSESSFSPVGAAATFPINVFPQQQRHFLCACGGFFLPFQGLAKCECQSRAEQTGQKCCQVSLGCSCRAAPRSLLSAQPSSQSVPSKWHMPLSSRLVGLV